MTIGEISEKTNLPESTLRYYEKKGLIRVSRDKNGRRNYEESDIEWIKFIRRLKETGMLLKDIQLYSDYGIMVKAQCQNAWISFNHIGNMY